MEKEYRQEVSKVWFLVQKSDGWVGMEANSKEGLPSQRGFEKVEVVKTETFLKGTDWRSGTTKWNGVGATFESLDGRAVEEIDGGLFLVKGE